MQIRTFDGGLNTRIDPSLILANEGVQYQNIDNTGMILKSVLQPKPLNQVALGYDYKFKGIWLNSASERSYAEYKGFVYWTDANNKPQKFDGFRQTNLGIETPPFRPILEEVDPLDAPAGAPTTDDVDNGGPGISDDAETFVYCYTYYDSRLGRESPKSADASSLSYAANYDVEIDVVESTEDGVDKIRIYRTGDGISTMTLVMEVDNVTGTYTDAVRTSDLPGPEITTITGISNGAETLQYVYTYYNSQDGIESAPSDVSAEISLTANKEVRVNVVYSNDIQVDKIRIYRVGDGVTAFTLVLEAPNNYEFGIIDGIETLNLQSQVLDTQDNQVPPTNLKYLIEAYGILFGVVGDKLYFSAIGKPDAWPAANFIDFSRDITGLFLVPNGILVFNRKKTDILVGTSAADFRVLPISSEQGSISHLSGQLLKNIPTWVSLDGICNYSSGLIRVVSKDKLGKLALNVVNAVVYDEQYYITKTDGTVLVMDARFNISFKDYAFNDPVQSVLIDEDTFYAVQLNKLGEMFKGTAKASFTYLSPVFTEGEHTNTKLYGNIYVRSDSDSEGILFIVYIDGVEVLQKTLIGNTIHDVTPPAERQRGSNIQFSAYGVGTIYEIEYKVTGRQNGR